MCGVHGVLSRSLGRDEVARRLLRMAEAQRHRGPDDEDHLVREVAGGAVVGLGFVRLAILDLETGMQPIEAPEDGSVIACNGQVYNYLELTSEMPGQELRTTGDMEVALHLYRRLGSAFLQRLNGMYAGAVLDPSRDRLLLFRDRFGIKPLYYARTEEGLFFASEVRALLAGSGIRPELDREMLPAYLTYRYVPGERTLFRGVRRMLPGSLLEVHPGSGRLRLERYWQYLPGAFEGLRGREARERFLELLSDSVRLRLRADVEVGSLVSGGVDSSSAAVLAAGMSPGLKLFTVSFEEPDYDELPHVRHLVRSRADVLSGSELRVEVCLQQSLSELPAIVRSVEDCVSLGTVVPTDAVCRLASSRVKTVLTGEGADEVFAGYRKFLLEAAAAAWPSASAGERERLRSLYPELEGYMPERAPCLPERYVQSEALFRPSEIGRMLGIEAEPVPLPDEAVPEMPGETGPVQAMMAMECRARLPEYVALRLDKLAMRHSLETRTPYLDYRLAELAAGVPVEELADPLEGQGKLLCRRALLEGGVLDRETAFRPKRPFTIPMAAWLLRGEAPDFVREVFEGGGLESLGLLDAGVAEGVWRSVTTEGVGPDTLVSAADRAFALLTLSLWASEHL